jgi:hypothetical protein
LKAKISSMAAAELWTDSVRAASSSSPSRFAISGTRRESTEWDRDGLDRVPEGWELDMQWWKREKGKRPGCPDLLTSPQEN